MSAIKKAGLLLAFHIRQKFLSEKESAHYLIMPLISLDRCFPSRTFDHDKRGA